MPTIRSHCVCGWISRQPQATWTSSCRGRGSCRSFLFPLPDMDLLRMRGGAMAMAVETKRWRITVECDQRRGQPCPTHTHIPSQRVSSLSSLSRTLSLSLNPSIPLSSLCHSLSFLFTRSLSTLRSLFVPSIVFAVSLYSPCSVDSCLCALLSHPWRREIRLARRCLFLRPRDRLFASLFPNSHGISLCGAYIDGKEWLLVQGGENGEGLGFKGWKEHGMFDAFASASVQICQRATC